MRANATLLISCLLIAIPSSGQKATKPPASAVPAASPKQEVENVYSNSWDAGEIKSCSTYSGQPTLLICDQSNISWKDSFINMLGDNAKFGEDEAYRRAFALAISRSKQFMVSFSEDAWPMPQSGRKLALWQCKKDSEISCKLSGRE